MAKELPYFKFEPNQWENGNIQMCTRELKGLFIDLCSMYWSRLGNVPLKLAVIKLCGGDAAALNSLCDDDLISIDDGEISILFLDEQLGEFEHTSRQNSNNAKLGWAKRRKDKGLSERNATALNSQSENNAIRGEKRREEKRKEKGNKTPSAKFSFFNSLIKIGAKKELVSDWIKVRKDKKASNTETAFNSLIKEVNKSNYDINQILTVCVSNSWKGFKSSWDIEQYIENKGNIATCNEEIITFNSNVNPTIKKLPKSQFLKMQENNMAGGYIYKIIKTETNGA